MYPFSTSKRKTALPSCVECIRPMKCNMVNRFHVHQKEIHKIMRITSINMCTPTKNGPATYK